MKIDFNEILNLLDKYMAMSEKWQDAFDDLNKIISPTSYCPIIEDSYVEAFISGVVCLIPELKAELEYYAWEVRNTDSAITEYKGKKYNAKKRKEFVKYLKIITKKNL